MGKNSIYKEDLTAGKHKKIERLLSIENQATIKKSTLVTNVIQQQRAYTMSPLDTPCYNTIIEDQSNNMFQSNNEERKIAYYDIPTDFPSESQKHKN